VSFPANSNEVKLKLYPYNDALPENDETAILTLIYPDIDDAGCGCGCGTGCLPLEYDYNIIAPSSATVTIKDDDQWKVSSTVTDHIALEPCPWISGAERHGIYRINRSAVAGKLATDRTYDISVEFELGGTATPGNNGSTGDYHLTKNPNGGVAGDMIYISNNKGTVIIPAGSDYVDVYVMPKGDSLFESDETVTLTVIKAYASPSNPNNSAHLFEIGDSEGTATIYQAPEFVSEADTNKENITVINHDFYHTSMSIDTIGPGGIIFTPQVQSSEDVRYTLTSNNSGGLLNINEETGEIYFVGTPNWPLYSLQINGIFQLQIKVENKDKIGLYDLADINIKLASVSAAKAAIADVFEDCHSFFTTWWIGSNTCERFALYFEEKLNELKANDSNVSYAIFNQLVVSFTTSGIISCSSPKHAAMRIQFIDGTELFYDNGSFGGIFNIGDIPDWVTPDF
jgi:hypothetical protein